MLPFIKIRTALVSTLAMGAWNHVEGACVLAWAREVALILHCSRLALCDFLVYLKVQVKKKLIRASRTLSVMGPLCVSFSSGSCDFVPVCSILDHVL